jgi:hypothetical protein
MKPTIRYSEGKKIDLDIINKQVLRNPETKQEIEYASSIET